MNGTSVEQRKARRFELRLPLELVRNGSIALSKSGETRNLSSVGVLFRSDASLRIGDAVEYMITLPSTDRSHLSAMPADNIAPRRYHLAGGA